MDALIPAAFVVAAAGHFAIVVASHNWWYGLPLDHRFTDLVHAGHALLFLAGPILFPLLHGWSTLEPFAVPHLSAGRLLLAGYVAACWLTALVLVPANLISRHFRRSRALLSEDVQTIDTVNTLGYKAIGDGKFRWLAHLPGNEVFQFDVTRREIALPALPPEWDGLTILHLSDFHFHGTPAKEYFRTLVDHCNDLAPDLIALTGDYVDTVIHHRWIVPLLGRLKSKLGVFAILGNHDVWQQPERVRRRLAKIGTHVIGNAWTRIEVRGRPLTVIGHEGPWIKPIPNLGDCPQEGFRLCLSHTPDNVRWARRNRIDLMLAGHVHGGQVCFPVVGPLLMPSVYGRRYDCGVFDEGPTTLHVTRGISGKEPVRYRCRPEAVLLTLRAPSEPSRS